MKGANEYCKYFRKAEQVGRLYILPHYHARGKTLRIYVLPEGEMAIENAGINPPLNKDAVEVYGVVGGNLGWTEKYGWIHEGPWQGDFEKIYKDRKAFANDDRVKRELSRKESKDAEAEMVKKLLENY
jgi:hypothetical protein